MDDNGDNIIHLVQPKPEESKLLNIDITHRKEYSQKRCKHKAVTVEEDERILRCNQGGSAIDPFEYILQCALDGEAAVTEIEELYARRDQLRESVANLEREEKNAKARLRTARTSILYAENDLKNTEQGIKT